MVAASPCIVSFLTLLLQLVVQWAGQADAYVTHACEGNHVTITCPMPDQVIVVKWAFYGRKSDPPGTPGRCGDNLVVRRRCEQDVTPIFKYKCEGHQTCEVYVDIATFGLEMCIDVRKYAEVDYECLSQYSFQSTQQCYQQCLYEAGSGASPHPFGSSNGQYTTRTQIPRPAGLYSSNSVKPATATATGPASGAASSSSSSSSSPSVAVKTSIPAPPLSHNAPALPYGNLSRSIANALRNYGGGSTASATSQTTVPRSVALRASLMARMSRMLQALRKRKVGK